MEIAIADRARTGLSAYLRRHVVAAGKIIRSPIKELSIALVSDVEMGNLHWQFMRLKGPTDVLTFELGRNAKNLVSAGELIICVPHARRQAAACGVLVRHEILLYAIHGLLHLSGHDDKTSDAFLRMHRTEDMILTKLGIGPVFAPAIKPAAVRRVQGRAR